MRTHNERAATKGEFAPPAPLAATDPPRHPKPLQPAAADVESAPQGPPAPNPPRHPEPLQPAAADVDSAPQGPPAPSPPRHPNPRRHPKPLQPAAADGEFPPQGPPAPDDESCTGGAGGSNKADGGAEAVHKARRIEGLLLGLAAGDAAGWPAARHRAARMPEWTRRLTRELDTFAEQNATTTLPVPIALNQPPEPLRLGPSDDAEWAAFAAEAVLRAGDDTVLGDLSRERRTRAAID
ncbi:ADP-ribosylglycohydrolase family protein, partial [Streptomyces sp. NPDC058469]